MSVVLQKGQDQRSFYLFILIECISVNVPSGRTALLSRYIDRILVLTGRLHSKTQLLGISFELQCTFILSRYMTDLPKHNLNVYLSKYKERFLNSLWQLMDSHFLNIKECIGNGCCQDHYLFKHGINDFAQRIGGIPWKLGSLAIWWSFEEAAQGSEWRKRVTRT